MIPARIDSGIRVWFFVEDSSGILRTGLNSFDVSTVVISPDDSAYAVFLVVESSQLLGIYYSDVPAVFFQAHGPGSYLAIVRVDTSVVSGTGAPYVVGTREELISVTAQDIDSIVDGVWSFPFTGFTTSSGVLSSIKENIILNLDAPISSRATVSGIISDEVPFVGANIDRSLSQVELNIRGADSDTLKTISDQVDGVSSGGGASVEDIVNGILDATLSGHLISDSLGEALTVIRGMVQQNYVLDNTVYNSAGFMTSGRIRIFASAAAVQSATDGGVGQGEVASFTITTSASGAGQNILDIYKVKRDA